MATWILGDIHGCADELHEMLERLDLNQDDRLVSCGDLFHRGPAPLEVARLITAAQGHFILGNHEHRLLARHGREPGGSAASEPPAALPHSDSRHWEEEDFLGDGDARCCVDPNHGEQLLRFLEGAAGYYLRNEDLPGAGETLDARPWVVVHAGCEAGLAIEETPRNTLMYTRRLAGRGSPWWYERYGGPRLVLFGHTPSKRPRSHFRGGQLMALGLDTGCVYGGTLSAYSPELDALEVVQAKRAYAR